MDWALIAGGSKGIGYYIAKALASRGYNILLIARNGEALAAAKNRLETLFPVRVETFSSDLSLPGSAREIAGFCDNNAMDLKIFCHAAGVGGSKDFLSFPQAYGRNMIRVNLESAMSLSLSLLPILQKNAPSYILNIGSLAGFAPIPVKNIYSATKSALLFFCYSLQYQLREKRISVSCLCPGPVFTKPSIREETIKKMGWLGKQMAVEPEMTGEIAVRGLLKQKMIIVPGLMTKLITSLVRVLPSRLLAGIFYKSGKR